MKDSPRLIWVREHAKTLLAVAEAQGAECLCLCGSVARGEDHDDSDIDFYARDFCEGDDARDRAASLVKTVRAMCPYSVDIRAHGMPGWLLDEKFEETMLRDAIDLTTLLG